MSATCFPVIFKYLVIPFQDIVIVSSANSLGLFSPVLLSFFYVIIIEGFLILELKHSLFEYSSDAVML